MAATSTAEEVHLITPALRALTPGLQMARQSKRLLLKQMGPQPQHQLQDEVSQEEVVEVLHLDSVEVEVLIEVAPFPEEPSEAEGGESLLRPSHRCRN